MRIRYIFYLFILSVQFVSAQSVIMSKYGDYAITPNDSDYIAYFNRIFYNNGFWVNYSSADTSVNLNNQTVKSFNRMVYRKYDFNSADSSFTYDSIHGNYPSFDGINVGDYALDFDGSNVFSIIGDGGMDGCRISKFDTNFTFIDSVYINARDSDASCNDQLLNVVNNKVVCIRMYNDGGLPYPHIIEYDKNLNLLRDTIVKSVSFISTGGVLMFHENDYHVITSQEFIGSDVYVYQFDTNWTYLGYTKLLDSAQWSQGYVKYGSYHIIAYHTPDEHTVGNIEVGIFDNNWNYVTSEEVTNFSITGLSSELKCAQRPSLMRKGDTLLVSYDITFNNVYPIVAKEQVYVSIYKLDSAITTSINTFEKNNIKIYPNPSSDYLTIDVENGNRIESIRIINLTGEEIFSSTKPENRLNINFLKKGAYFVIANTSDGKTYCSKLLIP